jgi:death-on-curing family protein
VTSTPRLDEIHIAKIKSVTIMDIMSAYEISSTVGETTRDAKLRPKGKDHIERVLDELKENVCKMDLFEALAIWAKDMIRYRPFTDANRRVIFECLQTFLRMCGYEMDISEEESIKIGSELRTMETKEIHLFIRDRAKSIALSRSK